MLKRFDEKRIRCPVVVYEEINAVLFWKEEDPERQKPKISRFLTFLCNFCQFLVDSVDFNLGTAQQGTSPLGFSEEIIAVSQMKKNSN